MAEVEIYTTRICPYCVRAKSLLSRKGVTFTEIDVGDDDALRAAMTVKAGGKHVGGCDDLHALDQAGGLDPLLELV